MHELGQFEGVERPDWQSTMSAVFGEHIDWANLKVFSGKHRPLRKHLSNFHLIFVIQFCFMTDRNTFKCPVTGKTALYCDPRTGVPYANVMAYRVLSQLLEHKYIWSRELSSYTASVGDIDFL